MLSGWRTVELLEMTLLKETGVGDSTCVRAGQISLFLSTENTLPATMDSSAARSSTNGAPKQ